jgi:anti-anti-sigma regulatory factor
VDETFDSTLEHGSGSSVVSVSGEVDVATAPELLGVLIGARERCTAAGVTIRLVVTEARILKIFEITGLTELFDIRGSREEAVAQ